MSRSSDYNSSAESVSPALRLAAGQGIMPPKPSVPSREPKVNVNSGEKKMEISEGNRPMSLSTSDSLQTWTDSFVHTNLKQLRQVKH